MIIHQRTATFWARNTVRVLRIVWLDECSSIFVLVLFRDITFGLALVDSFYVYCMGIRG